jgi:hypothetical protein
MEAFHKAIGGGMVGRCPRELYATQFGQGVEELRLELPSLVGGDGLRATESGYPAGR